jgi:hypothetical protein
MSHAQAQAGSDTSKASSSSSSGDAPQDFGSNSANQATVTTFSDTGGYTYQALADGSYKITAAPRASTVGLIVSEGKAYDAIHALYCETVPPEQRIGFVAESDDAAEAVEPADGSSFFGDLLEDISEGVSDVADFFEDSWEAAIGWWTEDEAEETTPEVVPEPEISELQKLMANDTLDAEQISRARELIAEAPEQDQADLYAQLQDKVIFRNQRNNESDNETSSGGTCNLTSLAMCLEYLGVSNPHPEMQFEDALDKIRIEKDYGPITYASTWAALAKHFGHDVVDLAGGKFPRSWWEGTMQGEYLSKGYGVLVSINGHVVRLQGTSSQGVIVDDPYGASLLKGGTSRGWNGSNGTEADGTDSENVGEDLTWSWDSVEAFSFKYFRAYR